MGCSLLTSLDDLKGTPDTGWDVVVDSYQPPSDAVADVSDAGQEAEAEAGDPYALEVLADSPIVYYRFNDPLMSTVAHDIGSANLDGHYGANVTRGVPGLVGGASVAIQLPGTATVDSIVRVPEDPRLEFTTAMSLEFWVNAALPGAEYMLAYGADQAEYAFQVNNSNQPTYLLANVLAFTPNGTLFNSQGTHHIVATFDGQNLCMYIDGAPEKTMLTNSEAISGYDGVNGLGIGGAFSGDGPTFTGTMGEVALYDHALTGARVFAHYMTGSAAPPTD